MLTFRYKEFFNILKHVSVILTVVCLFVGSVGIICMRFQ